MADWYPEGGSSNLARVNIFQLTSAVSDYHKKKKIKKRLSDTCEFGRYELEPIRYFHRKSQNLFQSASSKARSIKIVISGDESSQFYQTL